jgi:DinB superfamily
MADLRHLGARSVPVVSRGDRFVFAQNLGDVTEFLGIDSVAGPALSPAELAARLELVLSTAQRLLRQLPAVHLGDKLPNRNRSYGELGHHIFRIPEAFVDALASGEELTQENIVGPPGPEHAGIEGIVAYGDRVRAKLRDWWAASPDKDGQRRIPTYYGPQRLHEVLERTTWHSTQHVRQLRMVLEGLGVIPDRPLGDDDLAGLPLPEKVWDD